MGIEAQDLVDRVILRRGHIPKLLCAIQMGDHADGLVHLLHTVRHLAGLRVRGVVLVVVVLGIIGLLRLGGRPPVVAVVLHLVPGGVVAGQTAVVAAGEGVIGDLADEAAADGRSLGVRHRASRLGRHLGVAGDDDVIGVAGVAGRIRVYLIRCACAVADTGSPLAAHGLDGAALDGDVAASALDASADACAAEAAFSLDGAALDGDIAAGFLRSSADSCAAACAALGGEGAVLALVVLDGQLAGDGFAIFRPFIVLLKARIVAAALQLVVAVQLDGGIVAALDPDSSFALAADVNFQVVEGDVHVALGGVDGDGMLLRLVRLAGDDGLPLILLELVVALLDLVIVSASIARTFDRNIAVGDVPYSRIGRDAGAHHDARDDGGGHAPPECALQSHSTSPFVLCIMQCRRCGSGSPLRGL